MGWAIAGVAFGLSIVFVLLGIRQARRDLVEWAKWHGYVVERSVFQWIPIGVQFRTANHRVFDVTLVDGEGRRRQAWAWVGHWYFGLLKRDQVHIEWRDP